MNYSLHTHSYNKINIYILNFISNLKKSEKNFFNNNKSFKVWTWLFETVLLKFTLVTVTLLYRKWNRIYIR